MGSAGRFLFILGLCPSLALATAVARTSTSGGRLSPERKTGSLLAAFEAHLDQALGHRNGLHLTPDSVGKNASSIPPPAPIGFKSCGVSFRPSDSNKVCSPECPLLIVDLQDLCFFKCISRETCIHGSGMPSSFVNEHEGLCEACMVPGCSRCGASKFECIECGVEGGGGAVTFDLIDGKCHPHSRHYWHMIYCLLGVVLAVILTYVVLLWLRPVVNQRALDAALVHRTEALPRPEFEDGGRTGHAVYPLTTNLCMEDISGVGVLLHFRFQAFWLIWASLVCLAYFLTAVLYGQVGHSDLFTMLPQHEDFFKSCEERSEGEINQIEAMRVSFLHLTAATYFLTTAACFWFSYEQRSKYKEVMGRTSTMADFALLCEGLPKDDRADSQVESELTAYFRQALGNDDAVVGVSVCWDIADCQDEISDLMCWETLALDRQYNRQNRHSATAHVADCQSEEAYKRRQERWMTEDEEDEEEGRLFRKRSSIHDDSKRICCEIRGGIPQMRCGDSLFLDTSSMVEDHPIQAAVDEQLEEQAKQLLASLKSTGCAFVVFSSEAALIDALARRHLGKFRDQHEVTLAHYDCDCHCINWNSGFRITVAQRTRRIMIDGLMLLGLLVIWSVCFYGPFAAYIVSHSSIAGMSQGSFIEGTLLGGMITLGNQIVYYGCSWMADRALFRNRENRDYFEVIFYSTAIFVNTSIDLWVTFVMANGFMQDTLLDAEAVVRNPTMQQALYVQFLGYLFPGTLLLPFLFEPLPMTLFPYYIGKWVVRSREEVHVGDAERCLVCPPFDLKRYGDILVNVALVILCFFLTSSKLWWIFLWLALSLLVIYAWDHVRFLRFCSLTYFNTKRMEITGQYLAAVPCAALAAAFVFKLFGGQALVRSWDRHEFFMAHAVWTAAAAAFFLHLVIHILVIRKVIPKYVHERRRHPASIRYSDVAKELPCTWFNTNPVHCLKSKYVHSDSPHLVHYQAGKYYLQRSNPEIGAHFEDHTPFKLGKSWKKDAEEVAQVVKHIAGKAGRYVWPHSKDHRSKHEHEHEGGSEHQGQAHST